VSAPTTQAASQPFTQPSAEATGRHEPTPTAQVHPDATMREAPKPAASLPTTATTQPIQVEVRQHEPGPIEFLRGLVVPYIQPLATAGMVIIFVIFMLLQREDIRDRVIRLVSGGQLNVTTKAMDDAATRISRYLLMQVLVNATYGIPIGVGLYLIGVPNAPLWGLLAFLLRFIPYLGAWIAASMPILLSFAVF